MKELGTSNCEKFIKLDDIDFDRCYPHRWTAHENGQVRTKISGVLVGVADFIMGLPPINMMWDHSDLNPLNNQRSNLRLATRSQNNANRAKILRNGKSSSKYKGVCWDKSRELWMACIVVNKKQISLGRFKNEVAAARAYNEAALRYFKEFAYINKL